jgi:hypothetical protein
LKDLEKRKETAKTHYHIPMLEHIPNDNPLRKQEGPHQDGVPNRAKFYDPRLLALSNITLANGWKLVDPNDTYLEPVDRSKTGENYDWSVVTRDSERERRISYKEPKKMKEEK